MKVLQSKGILHRDLKPQNILLCHPEGRRSSPVNTCVKIGNDSAQQRSRMYRTSSSEPHLISLTCSWLWVCTSPPDKHYGRHTVWLAHVHGEYYGVLLWFPAPARCNVTVSLSCKLFVWTQAPEVIMSQHYDAKADLWSIGTIVYQCLTGKAPFHVSVTSSTRAHADPETVASLLSCVLVNRFSNSPNKCLLRSLT